MPRRVKQLKSRCQDLRELFEHNITVRHVLEELQSCNADDDATTVRKLMEDLDFDVMGLEDKGEVYGYIERTSLGVGPCRGFRRAFLPSEILANSTPLMDLLVALRETPRIFVEDHNRVMGIVTRGDLQKATLRMLLFGFVTLLEMHLLRLVRIYYPEDSWRGLLKYTRLDRARELLSARKARNEAVDLADCLQLCDKIEIVLRTPKIREHIEGELKKNGRLLLKSVEKLRDRLAHAQDLVVASTWPEVIDSVSEMERLLELFESIQ